MDRILYFQDFFITNKQLVGGLILFFKDIRVHVRNAVLVVFDDSKRFDGFSKTLLMTGVLVVILSPMLPKAGTSGGATVHTAPARVVYVRNEATLSEAASAGKVTDEHFAALTVAAYSALKTQLYPPQYEQIVIRRVWTPVTAYSSTPDQTDDTPFITASGTRTRDGVVAANFLPIGTKVRMPTIYGDKVFVVEDRMNSRYYLRMDIWMASRQQALQFGKRTVPIEIIREI